jgi:hypothetical protein
LISAASRSYSDAQRPRHLRCTARRHACFIYEGEVTGARAGLAVRSFGRRLAILTHDFSPSPAVIRLDSRIDQSRDEVEFLPGVADGAMAESGWGSVLASAKG